MTSALSIQWEITKVRRNLWANGLLGLDHHQTSKEINVAKSLPPNNEFKTLGYRNHKSCKILPKFLPTLHFLQESYKFVQESQILQICYNVEHFLQDFGNISAKIAFLRKKFLQKMRCVISTKNSFKTVRFIQFCVFLNDICFKGLYLKQGYLNGPGSIKDAFRHGVS